MPKSARMDDKEIVAVIIPAYRSADHIGEVLEHMPAFVRMVIVVDDCSPDHLCEVVEELARRDKRIHLLRHETNQGVGGAMVTGYNEAVRLGATILVKMDSDGQMDPAHLPALLQPLLHYQADYSKGNRFLHGDALLSMPVVRRYGNAGLSMLTKAASGYWNIFDPANGYTALRSVVWQALDVQRLHRRYFFETSMLIELGMIGAVVQDVYIPAFYGNEKSSLSELNSLSEFPPRLFGAWIRRLWAHHVIRDFSALAVFTGMGFGLTGFGLVFGITNWLSNGLRQTPTPTGTIMIAVLSLILGIQFLIQGLNLDIYNVPAKPISKKLQQLKQVKEELSSGTHSG